MCVEPKQRFSRPSIIKGRRALGDGPEALTTDPKGFVCPSVCNCEILANLATGVLEPFNKGEIVRRTRRTIGRGSGARVE